MQSIFKPSENPGAFERHLLRRENNPLFGERKTAVNDETLEAAQHKDHDILLNLMEDFQDVMKRTLALQANEDSEVVLEIKAELDRLYARAACVADDQTRMKTAIKKLLGVIMKTVREGAGNDALAQQELDTEEKAREVHFELMESQLAADILDAASPIENMDLVPTLLSADKDDLALTVQLFDKEQVKYLLHEGTNLLNKLDAEGVDVSRAAENFVFIEGYGEYIKSLNAENQTLKD